MNEAVRTQPRSEEKIMFRYLILGQQLERYLATCE